MSEYEQFLKLKRIWYVMCGYPTEEFPTNWLWAYIPKDVYEKNKIYTIYSITIDKLISICKSDNAIEMAFHQTISNLTKKWHLINPVVKIELIDIINEFGYQEYFPDQLKLTDSEEKMLRVRWDIADIVYDKEKSVVFKQLVREGINLSEKSMDSDLFPQRRNMIEIVRHFTKPIIGLLQFRAQSDIAAVLIAHPNEKAKYIRDVKVRQESEYVRLLVMLRTTIEKWLRDRSATLPDKKCSEMTEKYIEPFKDAFKTVHRQSPNTNTSVLTSMKNLINQGDNRSMNITVTGNGNVIGDNNRVIAIINKNVEATYSRELAEAFVLLRGTVLELNDVNEKTKRKAVRAIEDAEDEMSDNDAEPAEIEDSLKRVKSLLEKSGQVFDEAEGWGARFIRLAKIIMKVLHSDWNWLSTIF